MNHSLARIGLPLGPLILLVMLWLPVPSGMEIAGMRVAGIALLMAVWWLTEAIPIAATALLPVVLFPLLGVMSGSDVTRAYANHLIYLFLGGFLIAVTMEKWNLHHRIALHTIRLVGLSPARIVLGFMLATAFLSMWISNTATAMMMITIAVAVLREMQPRRDGAEPVSEFATALVLGVAYAASIGGVATLIGTPPNAILAGVIEKTYGRSLGFLEWMKFGVPVSLSMLMLTWWYLVRVKFRCIGTGVDAGRLVVTHELARLGPMTREEKYVALVFSAVALLWILNGLGTTFIPAMVKDSTIAVAGALVLFMIPVNRQRGAFLLDWNTAVSIPWDVIILFGGGFALAQGFQDSGLTHWLAVQLEILRGANLMLVIAAVVLLVIFLTEVTSNTATASLLIPVTAALATAVGVHPFGLMVAAVISASFAFMLPVATPPNAIVYSSRHVSIAQMAGAGFWLNLIGVVLITALVYWLLPVVWDIPLRLPLDASD